MVSMATTSVGPGPLKVPALALGAEGDQIHAPASVRLTAQRIGAEYRVIPDMSHWMLGERGAAPAAEVVLAWMESVGV